MGAGSATLVPSVCSEYVLDNFLNILCVHHIIYFMFDSLKVLESLTGQTPVFSKARYTVRYSDTTYF